MFKDFLMIVLGLTATASMAVAIAIMYDHQAKVHAAYSMGYMDGQYDALPGDIKGINCGQYWKYKEQDMKMKLDIRLNRSKEDSK